MPQLDEKLMTSFKVGILLLLIFFFIEVIGGILSNSLSLLSDAGHMFRDVFALIISFTALKLSRRPPTRTKTYGYHRVEIFAALINSVILLAISILILYEAYTRLQAPPEVQSPIMIATAMAGLIINLYIAYTLHGISDINVKSAYFHVLTDTLSSILIIIGSSLIFITGKNIIDPIVSIVIVIIIIFSSYRILKEVVRIFLEFTPEGIDFDGIIEEIESIDGIKNIHNIHIWSLCSNINVFDAHIMTDDMMLHELQDLKAKVKIILKENNISYSTLEFECESCDRNRKFNVYEH